MSNSDQSTYVLRYNEISTRLEYAVGSNWVQVPSSGGGTPGGANGDLQYNNSGAFGGDVSTTDGAGNITATSFTASGNFISTASGYFISQTSGSNVGGFALQDVTGNQLVITIPNNLTNAYNILLPANYGPGPLVGTGSGTTQLFFTTATSIPGTGTVSPGDASGVLQYQTTVTGNLIINGPIPAYDGQKLVFRITNDGSHSVTFATGAGNFAFGTTIPSYTNSVSLTDVIGVIWSIAAGRWYIVAVSQGF